MSDDAQPTGTLRNQHVAPWEPGHRPGIHEPIGHRHHTEVVMGRLEHFLALGRASAKQADGDARHCSPNHVVLLEGSESALGVTHANPIEPVSHEPDPAG